MKKIILLLLATIFTLHASLKEQEASLELIDSEIPIVDIRTPSEWRETGLLKGSIPIMLFDEKGKYDLAKFLDELNKAVDTSKPFALICRTGSRTSILAPFLSQRLNYDVINLKSGLVYAKKQHLPFLQYKVR